MKIYISVDMEGIAGILLPEQLVKGETLYYEARKLMTREVNVIIEELIKIGVKDIVVKDAHGSGFNFLIEDLHPDALYVMGGLRVDQRFPLLDSSFTGAFLIGYHAKSGTKQAIRDHTISSHSWQSIAINGIEIGEIGLDSLLFGLHNVPIMLVTGDDKACKEVKEFLGEDVVTYITKYSLGRHAGIMLPPKRVYKELAEVVKRAIDNSKKCSPFYLNPPYEMVVRYMSTEQVDRLFCDNKRVIRIDGVTVKYKEEDLMQLLSHVL